MYQVALEGPLAILRLPVNHELLVVRGDGQSLDTAVCHHIKRECPGIEEVQAYSAHHQTLYVSLKAGTNRDKELAALLEALQSFQPK